MHAPEGPLDVDIPIQKVVKGAREAAIAVRALHNGSYAMQNDLEGMRKDRKGVQDDPYRMQDDLEGMRSGRKGVQDDPYRMQDEL